MVTVSNPPAPRRSARIVWNSRSNSLWLFGGWTDASNYVNDVVRFELLLFHTLAFLPIV